MKLTYILRSENHTQNIQTVTVYNCTYVARYKKIIALGTLKFYHYQYKLSDTVAIKQSIGIVGLPYFNSLIANQRVGIQNSLQIGKLFASLSIEQTMT